MLIFLVPVVEHVRAANENSKGSTSSTESEGSTAGTGNSSEPTAKSATASSTPTESQTKKHENKDIPTGSKDSNTSESNFIFDTIQTTVNFFSNNINFIFYGLITIMALVLFIYSFKFMNNTVNGLNDIYNRLDSIQPGSKTVPELKPLPIKTINISESDMATIKSMFKDTLSKSDFILEKKEMLSTIKATMEEKVNAGIEDKLKNLTLFEVNGQAVTIPKVFKNYLEKGLPKINNSELISRHMWDLIVIIGSIYGELYEKTKAIALKEAHNAFHNNFKSINIFTHELKVNKSLFEKEYSEDAPAIDKILSVIDVQRFANYDISQNSSEIFGIVLINTFAGLSDMDISNADAAAVIKSPEFKDKCEEEIKKLLSTKLHAYIASKKSELVGYISEVKEFSIQVIEKIAVKKFRQLDFVKKLNKLDANEEKLYISIKALYENMASFIEEYYHRKYFFVPMGVNYKDKQYQEYINENFEEASEQEAGILLKKYDVVDVIYECYHDKVTNKSYKATVKVKLF